MNRMRNELVILNLIVVALIVVVEVIPSSAIRTILGVPFALFIPGYVFIAALFPSKEGIRTIERIILSIGASIAVVPLIGLILSYTSWGITLESVLYSVAFFIPVMSLIAWARRRRLPQQERAGIRFRFSIRQLGRSARDNALSLALVVGVLAALGTAGYVAIRPAAGDKFTEFYLLPEGETQAYPEGLVLGQEGMVVVGIVNQERETVSYRVEVRIDGTKNNEVSRILLEHQQKWEETVHFLPGGSGDDQKVEFFLYRNEEAQFILSPLYLWIDVTE